MYVIRRGYSTNGTLIEVIGIDGLTYALQKAQTKDSCLQRIDDVAFDMIHEKTFRLMHRLITHFFCIASSNVFYSNTSS